MTGSTRPAAHHPTANPTASVAAAVHHGILAARARWGRPMCAWPGTRGWRGGKRGQDLASYGRRFAVQWFQGPTELLVQGVTVDGRFSGRISISGGHRPPPAGSMTFRRRTRARCSRWLTAASVMSRAVAMRAWLMRSK